MVILYIQDVKVSEEVGIKSFSEIMEEKRRRLGEVQPVSSHITAQQQADHLKTHKTPVIAARKMKIRTAENSKTAKQKSSKLKRTTPPVLQG